MLLDVIRLSNQLTFTLSKSSYKGNKYLYKCQKARMINLLFIIIFVEKKDSLLINLDLKFQHAQFEATFGSSSAKSILCSLGT